MKKKIRLRCSNRRRTFVSIFQQFAEAKPSTTGKTTIPASILSSENKLNNILPADMWDGPGPGQGPRGGPPFRSPTYGHEENGSPWATYERA
ncbi:hypothetical protein INR49_029705 [Caranx melampygus]|nr:hypothetical protein INR49_029705 [Caranx melampygus]